MTDGNAPAVPGIATRFRGFLPVVVDIETGGFDPGVHALLEIAAVMIEQDQNGYLRPGPTYSAHVEPYAGSIVEPEALKITGIDLEDPARGAVAEREAVRRICTPIRQALRDTGCKRAVMVAHNPAFDMSFYQACIERCRYKRSPFHPFTTFDTATLGGLIFGQTVLSRAIEAAGLSFETDHAHSAAYDAEVTARLFCEVVNRARPVARVQCQRSD